MYKLYLWKVLYCFISQNLITSKKTKKETNAPPCRSRRLHHILTILNFLSRPFLPSVPSSADSSTWKSGGQCARGGCRWAAVHDSGRQTSATCAVVTDREGPAHAVGSAGGGDAWRSPETKERHPGHDGGVPLPDRSVQRAEHQTQRGTGPAQCSVWVWDGLFLLGNTTITTDSEQRTLWYFWPCAVYISSELVCSISYGTENYLCSHYMNALYRNEQDSFSCKIV